MMSTSDLERRREIAERLDPPHLDALVAFVIEQRDQQRREEQEQEQA